MGLLNLEVPRNGHFFRQWQFTDIDGVPVDLSTATLSAKARDTAGGAVLATATITAIDAAVGKFSVKWTGSHFDSYGSPFEAALASYDVKIVYGDGIIDVPVRGHLIIVPESTA